MVLKDWKLIKNHREDTWYIKRNKKDADSRLHIAKDSTGWEVTVSDGYDPYSYSKEGIKTKTAALKYAKSYMRSH